MTVAVQEPAKSPSAPRTNSPPNIPQCYGHRGASAAYPENTLASFEAAIRAGAEGIETDVHIAQDDEIIMFHDPHLDRTTNGSGLIHSQKYHGGLDKLLTIKQPSQKIPTLRETLDLFMKPENQHVRLHLDIKIDNDPERLFSLMATVLKSYPDHETLLGPRIELGLWHPKYIAPARRILPSVRLLHIGVSPTLARKYFWGACAGFSINFGSLVTRDGAAFRKECKAAGKDLYVWTVNDRKEFIQATKWGVKVIMTDKASEFLALRAQMDGDWAAISSETSALFAYTSIWYTSLASYLATKWVRYTLTKTGGDFRVAV